jgi:TRAP-type C4-dicarboxylate transport system permease small subunit
VAKETQARADAGAVERRERIVAYIIVVAIALSIVSFLAIIIGTWSGMNAADFGTGLWPAVAWTPYLGLPLGIILIVWLVLASARRRSRASREDGKP